MVKEPSVKLDAALAGERLGAGEAMVLIVTEDGRLIAEKAPASEVQVLTLHVKETADAVNQ